MIYYGLYKITNLINGKMYIGQHTTKNIDDGYMGSGVVISRAIEKYGIQNFRKEWIMFCEDLDELNYYERIFVDQNWVDRNDTYNLILGGDMFLFGKNLSKETRNKISKSKRGKPNIAMLGKTHSDETKKKMSIKAKERLSDKTKHPMYGKHTIPWNKGSKGSQVAWNKGVPMTDEQKKKLSLSRKAYCEKHPNSNDRNSGKHWYNNGVKSILAFEKPEGFKEGRL